MSATESDTSATTDGPRPDQLLDALEAANANANRLVGTITAEQWDSPTPCTEWSVRQLVNHIAGATKLFVASASRTAPEESEDHLGDDPATSLKSATEANIEAWRSPGATDGMVAVPAEMPAMAALSVNVLDTGTHCWDLATAIGAPHGLTDDQIGLIDALNRQIVTEEIRSYAGFGDALDVAEGADLLTSMLAFVGRRA